MTNYTCELLENELTFFHNQIQSCCSSQVGPIYFPNYKGEEIDWNKIVNTKKSILKDLKNGIIPKNCVGCFNLKENNEYKRTHKHFTRLIISHWLHCNCGCIYCARTCFSEKEKADVPIKSKYYDFLPILKSLYEKKLLLKNSKLFVDFQGGDISVLAEFNEIIDLLIKNKVGSIRITTNNTIYQEKIAYLLKQGKCELMTSLDAGTSETYKKIKRIDKFSETISNLRRYVKQAPNAFVFVKYIIVKGINDNEKEVNAFLDLMFDIGVKNVSFEIDYRDIMMFPQRRFDIPKHYYSLLGIFKKRCLENNVQLTLFKHTENVLKQGYFGYNSN